MTFSSNKKRYCFELLFSNKNNNSISLSLYVCKQDCTKDAYLYFTCFVCLMTKSNLPLPSWILGIPFNIT